MSFLWRRAALVASSSGPATAVTARTRLSGNGDTVSVVASTTLAATAGWHTRRGTASAPDPATPPTAAAAAPTTAPPKRRIVIKIRSSGNISTDPTGAPSAAGENGGSNRVTTVFGTKAPVASSADQQSPDWGKPVILPAGGPPKTTASPRRGGDGGQGGDGGSRAPRQQPRDENYNSNNNDQPRRGQRQDDGGDAGGQQGLRGGSNDRQQQQQPQRYGNNNTHPGGGDGRRQQWTQKYTNDRSNRGGGGRPQQQQRERQQQQQHVVASTAPRTSGAVIAGLKVQPTTTAAGGTMSHKATSRSMTSLRPMTEYDVAFRRAWYAVARRLHNQAKATAASTNAASMIRPPQAVPLTLLIEELKGGADALGRRVYDSTQDIATLCSLVLSGTQYGTEAVPCGAAPTSSESKISDRRVQDVAVRLKNNTSAVPAVGRALRRAIAAVPSAGIPLETFVASLPPPCIEGIRALYAHSLPTAAAATTTTPTTTSSNNSNSVKDHVDKDPLQCLFDDLFSILLSTNPTGTAATYVVVPKRPRICFLDVPSAAASTVKLAAREDLCQAIRRALWMCPDDSGMDAATLETTIQGFLSAATAAGDGTTTTTINDGVGQGETLPSLLLQYFPAWHYLDAGRLFFFDWSHFVRTALLPKVPPCGVLSTAFVDHCRMLCQHGEDDDAPQLPAGALTFLESTPMGSYASSSATEGSGDATLVFQRILQQHGGGDIATTSSAAPPSAGEAAPTQVVSYLWHHVPAFREGVSLHLPAGSSSSSGTSAVIIVRPRAASMDQEVPTDMAPDVRAILRQYLFRTRALECQVVSPDQLGQVMNATTPVATGVGSSVTGAVDLQRLNLPRLINHLSRVGAADGEAEEQWAVLRSLMVTAEGRATDSGAAALRDALKVLTGGDGRLDFTARMAVRSAPGFAATTPAGGVSSSSSSAAEHRGGSKSSALGTAEGSGYAFDADRFGIVIDGTAVATSAAGGYIWATAHRIEQCLESLRDLTLPVTGVTQDTMTTSTTVQPFRNLQLASVKWLDALRFHHQAALDAPAILGGAPSLQGQAVTITDTVVPSWLQAEPLMAARLSEWPISTAGPNATADGSRRLQAVVLLCGEGNAQSVLDDVITATVTGSVDAAPWQRKELYGQAHDWLPGGDVAAPSTPGSTTAAITEADMTALQRGAPVFILVTDVRVRIVAWVPAA